MYNTYDGYMNHKQPITSWGVCWR